MEQKELMQQVKDYWKQHNIFQKSLNQRSDKFQIATYDGPPFASGTPHFGHGLVGAMKDTLLRYKSMKGYKVNRDRGRDCHGLPVEKAVEKALGIDGKKDIEEKLGVEKFTEACRAYVGKTDKEWRVFVDSIGRRADMDHAYYTMNLDFMESIIRVFQNMYHQNLVYKGFKVQRCCPSCATSLSNSEVNEGYKDKQDAAITIKFKITHGLYDWSDFETTSDDFVQVADCVIKQGNKFLMQYHKKGVSYFFPGGKVEKGSNLLETTKRELKEEHDLDVVSIKELGSIKKISKGYSSNLHMIEVEVSGEAKNMEPEKHPQMIRAEIIPSDNSLGFAVKIEETVVDDDFEIMNQFYDLYVYHHQIAQQIHNENADVNILAWTTTPRTLPSNMFLAVGKHIHYYMVFDKNTKEYYILAESLVKQYYKNPDEYILINILQGEDLVGVTYEPLFPFINQSKIEQKYKDQFFKVIAGEFVSTEDGTGIVHIAPGFGMDDFEAVAQILPREFAKDWLFIPVNEYGEFTDEVADWKGQSVFDANKEVITRLKTEKKLIGQKSYSHSYPHCWRCETPLISRALTSRFIKEPELTNITVPNAEKIGFVPESVKNRFIDVLKSAPDRNVSRNRYWGSPLPIWENQDNQEERIVIGNLDELYQWSKTGSKNLTKHIFIRHGRTVFNEQGFHDCAGKSELSELGKQEADYVKSYLKDNVPQSDDLIFVLSPLRRCRETALPSLQLYYSTKEIADIENKLIKIREQFDAIYASGKFISYIQDPKTEKTFDLGKNISVDFRITELYIPEYQGKHFDCSLLMSTPRADHLSPTGESLQQVSDRVTEYLTGFTQRFATSTIVTFSHGEPITLLKKAFRDFDYHTRRNDYYPINKTFEKYQSSGISTLYWDHTKQAEVDLHKPYVDNYRFTKDGHTYKRIPEVMDCWFESGSMPFGQAHYLGKENAKFVYPAEFIIEGLDQTRGRFRGMHVCGNAIMKSNSFNNVVINGLILAEDGKKMSKSLRNYPDPEYLFNKYGTDAYRLYMLASPAVRAEPMRFSEKGVEQVYKDFTSAMINAYKFFETYAKIDNFSFDQPEVYFLRHGKSTGQQADATLTQEAIDAMQQADFIERILRVNPDVIYTSPFGRTVATAERVQEILKIYRNRDVEIVQEEGLASLSGNELRAYTKICEASAGKKVLIVSHNPVFDILRSHLYAGNAAHKVTMGKLECIPLPALPISNELDKWILAAVHEVGLELEKQMDSYALDGGAKIVLSFVDKLNNWFIRRSRRRFWASGMDSDKVSAYTTLFIILERYMKLCAPFAPFLAEHIYLELQTFKTKKSETDVSVHLEHLPLSSEHYVNRELLDEIAQVRRIISLGLFIRSKNKIAVKQPLSKMEIKM